MCFFVALPKFVSTHCSKRFNPVQKLDQMQAELGAGPFLLRALIGCAAHVWIMTSLFCID